ncbi:hypothetical protein P9112_014081 [Eukaryota sp. TZLM1-RC]
MNRVFQYTAKQISINYGNALSKHFHEYVLRWLNIVTLKKFRLEQIHGNHLKKELLTKLNKVREAIIGGNFDEVPINDHIVFPFPQSELTLKFFAYVKHCLIPTFNVNPQRDNTEKQSLLDHHLHQGKRKAIRRNRFNFIVRRQKKFSHFVQKIKNMDENRQVIIWFGKGGDGPSRQRVKHQESVF